MTDDQHDSDLRRRAAWLLAALAVVAVLVVVILTTLLHSSGGGKSNGNSAAPDDTLLPSSQHPTSSVSTNAATPSTGITTAANPSGGSTATTATTSASNSPSGPTTTSCPSSQPCILQGDAADVLAAVNQYRTSHGEGVIGGKVTKSAQQCALSNGGGDCSGSWAESQVGKFDGKAAVAKIAKLGDLLSHTVKSIDIGWAYSPPQKQYYIAIVWHG